MISECSPSEFFLLFAWRSLTPCVLRLVGESAPPGLLCCLVRLLARLPSHRPVLQAALHRLLSHGSCDQATVNMYHSSVL